MPRVPRIALRISAVIAVTAVTACSPSENSLLVPGFGPAAAVAIIVSPSSASVEIGLTLQMTGTLVDGVGREVPGSLDWASSSNSVATVNEDGLVTGVAVGVATITASAGTLSRGVNVAVLDPNPPPP